ncbi:PH domain-containing protein [Streptomyces cupreus]|uniref:PH domain-containing protein n=1 Tax=Streptomyces cupreus TaxID=2759956 RepID=A0A7X1IZN9_9ACTN|nr:PH domain-containing protein [Streptomyces cupreus]MBC2900904.1 PH domain-containing protein [Streptomyces cupreus]
MTGVNSAGEVIFRSRWRRALWVVVGITAAGVVLAALGLVLGGPVPLAGVGVLCLGIGLPALRSATAEIRADARGLHIRTLLNRRGLPWQDIADLRLQLRTLPRGGVTRRVVLAASDGHRRLLPLPAGHGTDDPDFDTELDALRTLHRRHGTPESDRLAVVTQRTAGGRGSAWSPVLCVLFLVGAGLAAWLVPHADANQREWQAAVPCTASTPTEDRRGCLTTIRAVVERTDDDGPKRGGRLYFADDRPLDRLRVSQEAAQEFEPGDQVELTVWRGEVMEVEGSRYTWREHVTVPGDLAAVSAGLALAAGCPAAQMLMRLRGRRLPDDEVLPSALPFAAVLVGTGMWLLPLCYLHPTTLFDSPTTLAWAAAGTAATLAMTAWAWRATRIRTQEETGAAGPEEQGEVFLPARFLESTDYNPHGFGTHIAVGGDGPPAVTPGPGRFAARTIPARRITVKEVRRVRGADGDTVPRSWHIADLDDSGTPVRLAAAPADLARILRALEAVQTLEDASTPASDR